MTTRPTRTPEQRALTRRRLIASVSFCLLVAVVLTLTAAVLKPGRKGNAAGSQWPAYLAMKRDSVDVVYFGTSHAFTGIDPMAVWEAKGIPGFVIGGASQDLKVTEYYVREALRTQRPKVIVVEMAGAAYDGREVNRAFQRINVAYMPWSQNRIRAALEGTEPGDRVMALLDLWPLHARPSGLGRDDFELAGKYTGYEYLKGFRPARRPTPVSATPATLTPAARREADREVARNLPALRRIVKLAADNDAQVLLLLTPTSPPGGYTYHLESAYRQLASESGNVKMLDLDRPGAVPGISYEKDFKDVGHLAYTGAQKTAVVLAGYLASTYGLPDRRSEAAYRSWNEDAEAYDSYIRRRSSKQ